MCIFRYRPRSVPSASITTAVLWYSPGARRSNSEAITTTWCFRQRKVRLVLALAEILRPEQFLGAEDPGAGLRGATGQG